MRSLQVIFPAKGQVALVRQNVAGQPKTGQVLVRLVRSIISPGTELACLHQLPNTSVTFPWRPGYSACGYVLATGPGVDHLQKNQLVAVTASHASHVMVDADLCWPLPPKTNPVHAALFQLVSIALQGVRKAQVQIGQTVAVLGLGVIGNLAGQLAAVSGSTFVLGIDPAPARRKVAAACGFDAMVADAADAQSRLGRAGFDVVIEATGLPQPVNTALALARKQGRVILLGSTRGLTQEVNFYRDVHRKGLMIMGAHTSVRAVGQDHDHLFTHRTDGRISLELIAGRRLTLGPLVSQVVTADQTPACYAGLSNPARRK